MVIAIDGPAGAGKSTVASRVAEALGLPYLDSGAMYRCVALAAVRREADLDDPEGLAKLAAELEIDLGDGRIELDGEDVSSAIREPAIGAAASRVSVHRGVREVLVARQRALIESGAYVAEGRDVGTVVSPQAALKVFLTADAGERARRRAAQCGEPEQRVLAALDERDARDTGREHGALRAAPDSVEIDTTGLGIEEVVERVVRLARERGIP
jgi:cytidylate kinase